jgi:hypothetical protein
LQVSSNSLISSRQSFFLLIRESRIYDLLVSVESHITDDDLERDLLKALKDPSKSCFLNVVCQLIVCEDRLNAHYNKEENLVFDT